MVDNNYRVSEYDKNIVDFSKFTMPQNSNQDFIDYSSPNFILYIACHNEGRVPEVPAVTTYIFKKHKIYGFGSRWYDEMYNIIDDYHDIWYEPFLFIYEKDLEQAIRYIKLDKLS
jgi:hypothetical protein